MTRYEVVNVREESAAEAALREWFTTEAAAGPARLEEAARLIIGLVTTLLGVLLGVLALAGDPRPAYLTWPLVKALGAAGVLLLLAALTAGLVVVIPQRASAPSAVPFEQALVWQALLARKSAALKAAAITFGLGLAALAGVVLAALLAA